MSNVLFRKATAVWLVENTSLTFDQIADFCSLSHMEVRTIADGGYEIIRSMNPVENGQLTQEEIDRCQKDSTLRLVLNESDEMKVPNKKNNVPENDILAASVWLLRNYGNLPNEAIASITGASADIVETLRQRGKKVAQVTAKSPVSLEMCSYTELEDLLSKFQVSAKKKSS
jgi:hypothetical protein